MNQQIMRALSALGKIRGMAYVWTHKSDITRIFNVANDAIADLSKPCESAQTEPVMEPVLLQSKVLLNRGIKHLREWHRKYNDHQPKWLPPPMDVYWMDDVDLFIRSYIDTPAKTPSTPQPANTTLTELQDLPELLCEVAEMLSGTKEIRFPSIDELQGFSLMIRALLPNAPVRNEWEPQDLEITEEHEKACREDWENYFHKVSAEPYEHWRHAWLKCLRLMPYRIRWLESHNATASARKEREQALKEAAKICDSEAEFAYNDDNFEKQTGASNCAGRIRALSTQESDRHG